MTPWNPLPVRDALKCIWQDRNRRRAPSREQSDPPDTDRAPRRPIPTGPGARILWLEVRSG